MPSSHVSFFPCTGSNGEELVEGLFVLAHAKRSRLLLLGIANSIDLVQQLLLPGGALQVRALVGQPARRLELSMLDLASTWCSK